MPHLSIDADACTGHGRCYDAAPELIEPDDLGLARLLLAEIPAALDHSARRAVIACPERAITYHEDQP
jgi:ferredoxin